MARLLLLGLVLLLAGCKSDPVVLTLSGETMGTTYNITAIDQTAKLDRAKVETAVDQALAKVNAQMSNWDPTSEISKFNAAQVTEPQPISPELAEVMRAAMEVHEGSYGQFDVTLGPLIQLWGFGQRTSESPIPADSDIAAALQVVGQSKLITLTQDTMAKALPDTNVWLAAIAKGYGVDEIAKALQALGLADYMVEIGGDLVTAGNNAKGAPWRIGIERPDAAAQTIEEVVTVSGLGMATSGDYRNYFEEEGVRYSHIIDAVSGRPITHGTASVTVLADSAMLADGWATALLALGAERGLAVAQERDLAVLFILRDEGASELQFTTVTSDRFTALQGSE